jgi:predicted amidohydrolase
MPLVACVQLRSGPDVATNLARVEALVARAAGYGAVLVATPENTTLLTTPAAKVAAAEPLDGPTHTALAAIARRHRVWLLAGSVAERCETDPTRCHNTSVLFDDAGNLAAAYRKVHLFDIALPDGPSFEESVHIAPGDRPVVVDTPVGRLGMSVCYDLRFPEHYAALVEAGAEILSVPSAFTVPTGAAHWHTLLRARAIETQCFVLAPAQEGAHGGGRTSYGHTLAVDPWGVVLAECAEGEGLALAEVDRDRVHALRRAMPIATHRAQARIIRV